MTISEALFSLNIYPIPAIVIERIGVERSLILTNTYTPAVAISQSYELATADIYLYLFATPSIIEQEVGINQAISIKKDFKAMANKIYGKYMDEKFDGQVYGFIGENYNG